MKKILLSLMALLLLAVSGWAQAPQAMNYQAVVRGTNGNVLQSQNVNARFTVHDSSATGTAVYRHSRLPAQPFTGKPNR